VSGPIPVRVLHSLRDEPEDVLRHPARQARLAYRAMCECGQHTIDATQHCSKCRAPFWAVHAPHWSIENPRKYAP
jgi:hypothetical protein